MAERGEATVITIGGKGSALSSSSVHGVATGRAHLRIDSSALDRLSNQKTPASSLKLSQISISTPKTLTPIEIRAFLTALLNKLLHYSNSSAVRTHLPELIAQALNSKPESETLGFLDSVEVTEEESAFIERSCADLFGICGVLDHEAGALSTIVDAVAALSCEAAKGDDKSFDLMDTGDGYVDKEAAGVASDMKVLLKGYEAVAGKVEKEAISEIPKTNGRLREVVKSVHSMTRVELNSGVKGAKVGAGKAVGTTLSPLAVALLNLGKSSLCRAKINLDAVGSEVLRNGLMSLFENKCPNEDVLRNAYKSVLDLLIDEDYVNFVHQVNALLGIVYEVVAWEGITAFVALEGEELMNAICVEVNGGDVKVEKKSEKKKKKKKTVWGKGTSVIVQLLKDRLQTKGGDSRDSVQVLEKWVKDLLFYFDPKESEFDGLVMKVKEIVESNESRRLPKLPKVMKLLLISQSDSVPNFNNFIFR